MPPLTKKRLIPKSGTDIHVQQAEGEFVRVFCNGSLVAEVACQTAKAEKDWVGELEQARMLKVLPKILEGFTLRLKKVHNREDHNNPKPEQKMIAYLAGFADGLLGIDLEHPANKDFVGLNLRMQRNYAPCFSEGYETGEAIRCLTGRLK